MISFLEISIGLFSVLGVTALYAFICWGVGAGFSEKADLAAGVRIPFAFVMGTAVLSWLFSVLGMLRMLPGWGIGMGCVLGTGCALLFARHLNKSVGLKVHGPSFDRKSDQIIEKLVVFLALFYVFSLCIGWPRGGDQCIYHLVIPRSVLWNHGLVFNGFSHDAGMYYGWQMACLPAYFLGGERSFFLMALVCFALFLSLVFEGSKKIGLSSSPWLLVAVVAFVTVGMVRESLVNNETPLLLIEGCLLWMAVFPSFSKNKYFEALVFGFLCGFMVTVKLISLAVLPLLTGIFLWKRRGRIIQRLFCTVVGFTTMVLPWVAFTYWNAGTILPIFMLIWPPRWGILPQMSEGLALHMQFSGMWLKSNYHLLFSEGMQLYLVLLVAGLVSFAFLQRQNLKENKIVTYLAAYGLFRWFLMWVFSGLEPAAFFHNRYNLMTYLAFGCASALAVKNLCNKQTLKPFLKYTGLLVSAGIFAWFFTAPKVSSPLSMKEKTIQKYPSLWQGMCNSLITLSQGRGGGPNGIGMDWADSNLPKNAVIATTAIDPYLLNRPFIQVLPICQTQIDLNESEDKLYEKLLQVGATHLHLTEFSGLNGWMNPYLTKTLENLNKIPEKEKLEKLIILNYRDSKGFQSFYKLTKETNDLKETPNISNLQIIKLRNKNKILTWEAKEQRLVNINKISEKKITNLGSVIASGKSFPLGNQINNPSRIYISNNGSSMSINIEEK